jgi:small subunit ribosomal protein S2
VRRVPALLVGARDDDGGRTQPHRIHLMSSTMQPTGVQQPAMLEQLLAAGVHFGHQTRRWNPKMRRFIFAERNGIHIIDLQKTLRQLELAQKLVREVVSRGEQILFVCTKRQLSAIVKAEAERAGAFHITERWLGGLLTNYSTVKKQVKKLKDLEAGSEPAASSRTTRRRSSS